MVLNVNLRSDLSIDEDTVWATLQYIRPHPDELSWQSIPWQTDLFDAVRQARTAGKPVLLWTMNGNPLGCT